MDLNKRKILQKNHIFLKNDLDPLPVVDYLYSKGVFNDNHCEYIRIKRPRTEQNHELLTNLKTTGNRGYDTFCEFLETHQPHVWETLQKTTVTDEEIQSDVALDKKPIFFNPSEDFELKALVVKLTKAGITPEQFQTMKYMVTDEIGCSKEVLHSLKGPEEFFLHLIQKGLVTRYNLAFLQSLFWRVDLKEHCTDIARFASISDDQPIHFYSCSGPDNGFVQCQIHVKGNFEAFKGITVESICSRVSRYVGFPNELVIPVGIEPSNSIILTIMIPETSIQRLIEIGNCHWLADLGVDYIVCAGHTLNVRDHDSDSTVDIESGSVEVDALQRDIRNRMENETLLRRNLYKEQMRNVELSDDLDRRQEAVHHTGKDLEEQKRLNEQLTSTLMIFLHFIAQLLQYNSMRSNGHSFDLKERSAKCYFQNVVKKLKFVCDPSLVYELIDAHSLYREIIHSRQLSWVSKLATDLMQYAQGLIRDASVYRMVGRSLGVQPGSPQVQPMPQSQVLSINVNIPMSLQQGPLEPTLRELVYDIAKKLSAKQMSKLWDKYVPEHATKTERDQYGLLESLLLTEFARTGSLSNGDVENIIKDAMKICNRLDLVTDFQSRNMKRIKKLESQRESPDGVNRRLDGIERLLQMVIAQNSDVFKRAENQFAGVYDHLKKSLFKECPIY